MTPKLVFILYLIQLFCLSIVPNDPVIRPGSELVDGTIIRDYTNRWKVTHVASDGTKTPSRIWTDYGQIMSLNGTDYLHRVQDLYDPNMNLQETWINMVEHRTLRPLSFSRMTPSGSFATITFDSLSVHVMGNIFTNPKDTTTSVPQPVFDWNLYGILLVGLPFDVGFTARMPFYSMQSNTTDWLRVEVLGEEKLTDPSGSEIITTKIITDKQLTFWLTKEAPYVHQLTLELPNNAHLIWKTF